MASRITSCGSSLSPLKVLLEGSRDEIRLTDTRLKMGFLIAPFRYPSTQRLEMYRAFRHLSSDLKSWHHRSPLYNPPVCSAGDAHKSHGSEGRLDEYVDTLGRRGRDVDRLRILLSRPRRGLRQYPVLARGLLRRTRRRTKSGCSAAYDPQFPRRYGPCSACFTDRDLAPVAMDSRHDRGRRCRRDLHPSDAGNTSLERFDRSISRQLDARSLHRSGVGTVRNLDSSACGLAARGRHDPDDTRHLDPGHAPSCARTGSRWLARAHRRIDRFDARVGGATIRLRVALRHAPGSQRCPNHDPSNDHAHGNRRTLRDELRRSSRPVSPSKGARQTPRFKVGGGETNESPLHVDQAVSYT